MNSKKAITLLVLATMILALVPIMPVNATITNPKAWPLAGVYDDEIKVNGTGVTAGATVQVYWDMVQPWDAVTAQGLIGSAKAYPNGTFAVLFDVPQALVGNHYIWVKDTNTGETKQTDSAAPFVVSSSLVLSPTSGLTNDVITVNGYGFGATKDITGVTFANYTWTSTQTMTPGTPKSNALGSWSATFKVPNQAKTAYNVTANDGTYTAANETFTIGASITLSKSSGPSGTVVRISGRGFNPIATIATSNVTLNGVPCYVVNGPVHVDGNGLFTVDAVIPGYSLVADTKYTLTVNDLTNTPTAKFTVTGLPGVKITPEYQVQGGSITVTGTNYTQISGKTVDLFLGTTKIGEATTTATGTFSKTVTVPAVASNTYAVDANMTAYKINGTKNFRVGMMIVILSPDSGATGAQVTLTGTGFTKSTDSGTWNVTIGGKKVKEVGATLATNADGTISKVITIPTLPVGVHTVSVLDIKAKITVTSNFEVKNTAAITLDPTTVPNKFMVNIDGKYFTQIDGQSLKFQIYNATGLWDMTVGNETVSAVTLNKDGEFGGNWTISPVETLALGAYKINVTDGKDIYAEATLNIVDKTVSIDARKSVFSVGETVAFTIETSFAVPNSYIKVWDPSGNMYWVTDVFGPNMWVSLAMTKVVPFYSQTAGSNPMMLLDDAPIGQYTWKWYDTGKDTIAKNTDDEVVDSGVFNVQAAAADVVAGQVEDLANQITDLAGQLADVSGEFSDVKSDIANVAAVAQQAVAAAQQAAQAVQTVAQTANQANTAAQAAADAANAARDAANGLTTLVYGAIGAALVAALAAIVSLMQISRRIAG